MARAVKALDQDFSKLNTGRPSASILDNVKVDYYGVPTPVSQVGAIKIPEGNLMTIEPWDKSLLGPVEKAILSANLGITPNNDGSGIIRLPFTDGLVSHDLDLFPSYTAGLYAENGSVLFVTRGLGNSGPSFRVFNRPEVAVVTLHRGG